MGPGGHVLPTFTNGWACGHHGEENSKQETDQTVLTIMKALTKTNNCDFRAKSERARPQIFFLALPSRRIGATAPSPHFCSGPVPLPHFQIPSGAIVRTSRSLTQLTGSLHTQRHRWQAWLSLQRERVSKV